MTEIQLLFNKLAEFPCPETMKIVTGEITGQAFFPGGKGTFNNDDFISDKKVMILGQDFDCETNFNTSKKEGKEDVAQNPTWRNLLAVLKELNICPSNCFFTNAILGVRTGDNGVGKSPAFKYPDFIKNCRDFFLCQVEIQRPKAILVLGLHTGRFLADLSEKLAYWKQIKNFETLDKNKHQVKMDVLFENGVKSNLVLLTHPSYRHVNVKRREYEGKTGHKAEIRMIKTVLGMI